MTTLAIVPMVLLIAKDQQVKLFLDIGESIPKLYREFRLVGVKLWLHQCDFEIFTHGINFFDDNLFLFKLTLVETKFFTEQILPEYSCSTSENLKLSPQNSVLILEKFALVETTLAFQINTEWAVEVIV